MTVKHRHYYILAAIALIAVAICLPDVALAQDGGVNAQEGIGGAAAERGSDQLSGIKGLVLEFFLFLAIMVGGLCAIGIGLLGFDKAPQRLKEVGYTGVVIGFVASGLLASVLWLVKLSVGTTTGSDAEESDAWKKLNNESSMIIEAPHTDRVAMYVVNDENVV